jgi:hypothetical protein
MTEIISEKLLVVANPNSSSYYTNDTTSHFISFDGVSASGKTLCGIFWRKWRTKKEKELHGTLCEKCERIATKRGLYNNQQEKSPS